MKTPKSPRCICLLVALLGFSLAAKAISAQVPVKQLYEEPALALPKISANGKLLALRAVIDERQYLALMDLMTMKLQLVAKFDTTKLYNIMWKGDDLLLLVVQNSDGSLDFRSYDLKLRKLKFLSDSIRAYRATMECTLPSEPDDVVEQVRIDEGASLLRINTRTGRFRTVEKARFDVVNWIVNRDGDSVAAVCLNDKKYSLLWRASAKQSWQRRELGLEDEPRLMPFGLHPDQRRLLAWDATGPATKALVAFDPATMEKTTLFRDQDVDPDDMRYWGDERTNPTAVVYENDRPRHHFIDPDAARLQAAVDAALPETFNEVRSVSNDRNMIVIFSWSDRNSGTYYILDRRNGRLTPLGAAYPECAVEAMGQSEFFSYRARDGLKIAGRLLLPPGHPAKPPLIVKIGGGLAGPRSRYAFDTSDQIFATRGYAVARINYRGCAGFGRAFQEAGNYQFASAMVDDVMDGIDFLIAQGLVDGNRIALLTTGFGAVVGTNVLAHSTRFRVWLNEDSWFAPHLLEYTDLAFSPKNKKQVISDLGGEKAAKLFLQSLEPSRQLANITIPSFHLYSWARSQSANRSSSAIYEYLSQHPGLGKLVDVKYDYDPKIATHNQVETREEMLRFLIQTMPATAPEKKARPE